MKLHKITDINLLLKLIALLCLLAVGFALFSQHYLQMRPCAWCVLQRIIFLAIAAVCLVFSSPWAGKILKKFALGATIGLSVAGIVSAWYQYSVASEMFSCAQTFADRFITESALDTFLPSVFGVYATCMDARVELLGIEYALWGMALFILFTILGLAAFILQKR